MTLGTDALKLAWRDYVTNGVPGTGENEPVKQEIRDGLDALAIDIAAAGMGDLEEAVAILQPLVDAAEAAADAAADSAEEAADTVAEVASTIGKRSVAPLAVITDKDRYAALVIEADGHARRSMVREPARHTRGIYSHVETDRNGYALTAPRRTDANGIEHVVSPINALDTEVGIVSFYGQSLSEGYESLPIITPVAFSPRLVMFVGGVRPQDDGTTGADYASVVPLHETASGIRGETPASGAGLATLETMPDRFGVTLDDMGSVQLFHSAGEAGTEAIRLARGSGYYNRLTSQMRFGVQYARSLSQTVSVPYYARVQGEADISLQTPGATWRGIVAKERRDYERDVAGAVGEQRPVICVHTQTSSFNLAGYGLPDPTGITFAQAELCEQSPWFVMACPMYMLDYIPGDGVTVSGLHLTATSSKVLGAYISRAYLQSVYENADGTLAFDPDRKFRPLQPIRAKRQGPRVVDVLFHVPKPPLVWDTSWIAAATNYGFYIERPGAGDIALSGAPVIHARNRVRINSSFDLKAGDMLCYGLRDSQVVGENWETGRIKGARGNLADSEDHVFDPAGINRRLRNYCLHFRIPIKV
ncbi:hypothetical protein N6H05_14640 [Sphingobium sp. WTD-1]|uniref:hypothetical protein n=1 Tax=Sphingobium sp. WTD-1 TaxID=2979467 RepID=UPI0024DE25E9|nr:hypothetical protein [Sphingobium sp. WTD-1]WIA54301.1 hypothetical protein N6H05_14640 [Sphingobium sp. WTD-1]